jgi:hypothetical protein
MAQQSDEQFLQEPYQWFQKSDHWHDKALSLRAMEGVGEDGRGLAIDLDALARMLGQS